MSELALEIDLATTFLCGGLTELTEEEPVLEGLDEAAALTTFDFGLISDDAALLTEEAEVSLSDRATGLLTNAGFCCCTAEEALDELALSMLLLSLGLLSLLARCFEMSEDFEIMEDPLETGVLVLCNDFFLTDGASPRPTENGVNWS